MCTVVRAVKDARGRSRGIVVQERSATRQFVFEVRQAQSRRLLPFVVPPAHRQRDAAAGRNHDGGRPDFDLQIDRLARDQGLLSSCV